MSWRGQELSNQDCFLAPPDLFQGVDLIIPGIMHVCRMCMMFLGNPNWLWKKIQGQGQPEAIFPILLLLGRSWD